MLTPPTDTHGERWLDRRLGYCNLFDRRLDYFHLLSRFRLSHWRGARKASFATACRAYSGGRFILKYFEVLEEATPLNPAEPAVLPRQKARSVGMRYC